MDPTGAGETHRSPLVGTQETISPLAPDGSDRVLPFSTSVEGRLVGWFDQWVQVREERTRSLLPHEMQVEHIAEFIGLHS